MFYTFQYFGSHDVPLLVAARFWFYAATNAPDSIPNMERAFRGTLVQR